MMLTRVIFAKVVELQLGSLDDWLLELINDPASFICLPFPSSQSNFLISLVWWWIAKLLTFEE